MSVYKSDLWHPCPKSFNRVPAPRDSTSNSNLLCKRWQDLGPPSGPSFLPSLPAFPYRLPQCVWVPSPVTTKSGGKRKGNNVCWPYTVLLWAKSSTNTELTSWHEICQVAQGPPPYPCWGLKDTPCLVSCSLVAILKFLIRFIIVSLT